MEPHLVEQADKPPGKCLASRDTEGPFIDTGCYAMHQNPYIYLSVRWLEMIATKHLGMIPISQYERELGAVKELAKEQGERLDTLTRFEDAVAEYEQAKEAVYK